jgi:ATP:ADP antiporter, AAA family
MSAPPPQPSSPDTNANDASLVAKFRRAITSPEAAAVIVAFIFFFCLLASLYMLRPVREEMAVRSGIKNLPWIWTGTFFLMLVVTPIYGWLVSRMTRLKLLRGVYLFFIANIGVFYFLLQNNIAPAATTTAFYMWMSVFNLFVVSVFWTIMTDVFSPEQSKRLFGYIAAGGSIGAIAGPAITAFAVGSVGIPNLLLVSAAFLVVPLFALVYLARWAAKHADPNRETLRDTRIGGGALDALKQTWKSPMLRALACYFLLYVTLSTFLYFEQIRIVGETFSDSAVRTAFFAKLDLATNIITLTLQFGVTRWLMARVGFFKALIVLPTFTLAGFIALALSPSLAVLAVFNVCRRALDFAIARPAREALFTLVPTEERYKAKNFIDTAVYRGGDAASAWLVTLVRQFSGATSVLAIVAIPISIAWLGLVVWLARQEKHADKTAEGPISADTFKHTP